MLAVAPRKGRVSRNVGVYKGVTIVIVAPRKGRVSRNSVDCQILPDICVAPRKGRVSRNAVTSDTAMQFFGSRPARGV